MSTLPQNFIKTCLTAPSLSMVDHVEDPFEACSDFLRQKPIQSLYQSIHKDAKKANQALEDIARLLPDMHPYHAAPIALMCGSLVENKANPLLIFPACCDLMTRMLTRISPYWSEYIAQEDIDNAEDDKEREHYQKKSTHYQETFEKIEALPENQYLEIKGYQHAIDILVLPMMAMLMRNEQCRALFTSNTTLAAFLNNPLALDNTTFPSEQLYYLVQAMQLFYGEFIVILPATQTGFTAQAHAINNIFHALTLLQDLMAKHAQELDIGHIDPNLKKTQKATKTRYNWYNAKAYTNGKLTDKMALAWGEAPLGQMPQKQKHIILYAEEATQISPKRSWDEGFSAPIHSAQNAHIQFIRPLTPEEVNTYMQ